MRPATGKNRKRLVNGVTRHEPRCAQQQCHSAGPLDGLRQSAQRQTQQRDAALGRKEPHPFAIERRREPPLFVIGRTIHPRTCCGAPGKPAPSAGGRTWEYSRSSRAAGLFQRREPWAGRSPSP
jgi:hypothetical protein